MDDQRDDREGDGGVKSPRFSLKRLFISTILFGVGVSVVLRIFLMAFQSLGRLEKEPALIWLVFWLSGPMIGAGLLCPFRRTLLGVGLGILLQIFLYLAAVAVAFSHG